MEGHDGVQQDRTEQCCPAAGHVLLRKTGFGLLRWISAAHEGPLREVGSRVDPFLSCRFPRMFIDMPTKCEALRRDLTEDRTSVL